MYKTIVFDLGGVCFSNGTKDFISWISKTYHCDSNILNSLMNGDASSLYREGKISLEEFWSTIKAKTGIPLEPIELDNYWNRCYYPNSKMDQLLDHLKRLKYELLYLTDITTTRFTKLSKDYETLSFFRGGIRSDILGSRKPNLLNYQEVIKLSSSTPHEIVYIDDKASFLVPAKQLGLYTIHYTSMESLFIDLVNIGVL